jgi:hypothetical protein
MGLLAPRTACALTKKHKKSGAIQPSKPEAPSTFPDCGQLPSRRFWYLEFMALSCTADGHDTKK